LECARTTRAFGNVPAERGQPEAPRIRRREQPDLLDGILQVAGNDVRLHAGEQVQPIDLEDAVHPFERQDDSAARWTPPAGISRAGAACDDRDALVVAEFCELGDFVGRAWKD